MLQTPSGGAGSGTAARDSGLMSIGTVLNVLRDEFPEVALVSPTAPGVTHRYTNLHAFNNEVSEARIWAGFHWRFSTEVGKGHGLENRCIHRADLYAAAEGCREVRWLGLQPVPWRPSARRFRVASRASGGWRAVP